MNLLQLNIYSYINWMSSGRWKLLLLLSILTRIYQSVSRTLAHGWVYRTFAFRPWDQVSNLTMEDFVRKVTSCCYRPGEAITVCGIFGKCLKITPRVDTSLRFKLDRRKYLEAVDRSGTRKSQIIMTEYYWPCSDSSSCQIIRSLPETVTKGRSS